MTPLDTIAADWCASYLQAFNQADVDGVARHWAFPALILVGGQRFVYKSAEQFARNTSGLMEFYREQRVGHAERQCVALQTFTQVEMSIQVEDRFYDRDGLEMASWQAGYVLQCVEGVWRAVLASADGESAAWRARGTPLPGA